jgi:hypothetical protein
MATKISMIGKPGVGKTTIKKVIFEGEDPNKLIIFPLEATIGIQYSVHDFINLKLSLLDSPGQSLPLLLEDEQKQIITFGDSSAIIYVFDYPMWINNSQAIIDDIKKIYEIKKQQENSAKLILFLHKIDLIINKKIGSMLALIKKQITKQLNFPEEIAIYFTSLHPNLIYTVYNALSDILSDFSENFLHLKKIVKKIINGLSKSICIVSNQKNNLVIQLSSSDFDASSLYYLYEIIHRISIDSDNNIAKSKFVNAGSKILYMYSEEISNVHSDFRYLMFFSETLEESDLRPLVNKIKEDYNQYID